MKINEVINEIEYSSDVQKDDMSKYDLDDMIGSTESTGKKINGYEIHTIDEGDVSFLVKEPYGDGFLGELRLKPEHKYEGMHKSVVFFDEVIQGKGIAPLLYKMAIVDYGHTIVSDYKQSKGSKTLWERLAKMSGVFVYGWNPRAKGDKEFFQWDPTEDSDSVIYHGDSSTDVLRDELDALMKDIGSRKQSGELSAEQAQVEWNEGKKEISAELKDADLVRYNDIRLIATADNNLDESIGALMGMILPTHAAMYKKAAEMMSQFHDEYPSYGLNKLAALVSRRTAKDFDRRALVQTYKKQYPSSKINE